MVIPRGLVRVPKCAEERQGVPVEIRDPIHGPIGVSDAERCVVDHPFVQRLRNIKATGFSYLPFPGATHSRYAHSLGVMHLAGRAVDSVFSDGQLSVPQIDLFRKLARVAALCHDLGHAPFSHSTEFAMPPLAELKLDWYRPAAQTTDRATHEDYTIAILAHTSLTDVIDANFPFTARHVAALISQDIVVDDGPFVVNGLDYRRVLSQIISSELDVDRLDYLVRDSYFTGARYGQVDVPWLIGNMAAHQDEGHVSLALDFSALYAFDDFLIARHHMFLMVYFHHKSVVYEELLKRFVWGGDWAIPADLDAYLDLDDVALEAHLRSVDDPWARRLVKHDPYRRVCEVHGTPADVDLSGFKCILEDAGIDVISAGSTGKLSRYNVFGQKREKAGQIALLPGSSGSRITTLQEERRVLQSYADARRIARLYVAPNDVDRARALLAR